MDAVELSWHWFETCWMSMEKRGKSAYSWSVLRILSQHASNETLAAVTMDKFWDYCFSKIALVTLNCLPQQQCYMLMNCSCPSNSSIFSVTFPLISNKCRINKLRFPPQLTVSGNQIWSLYRVHKSSKKTYNGVEKLLGRGPMADLLILLISPCISWKEVSPLSHNYNN